MEIVLVFILSQLKEIMPGFSILVKKITGGKKMKAIICAVLIIGFAIALAAPVMALDYHENHPELLPGEKFIGNVTPEQFRQFRYKSKRLGQVAYDRSGRRLVEIDPMGGYRYRPVFVAIEELKAIHGVKEKTFPLHFYTHNFFFRKATVYMVGVAPGGREVEMKFKLEPSNIRCPEWEKTVTVPENFYIREITIRPKGKKKIHFWVAKKVRERGFVYILLSGCPLPKTLTRPRLNVNDHLFWPTGFKEPANIPADYM